MKRYAQTIAIVASVLYSYEASAQHHHHGSGYGFGYPPQYVSYPGYGVSGLSAPVIYFDQRFGYGSPWPQPVPYGLNPSQLSLAPQAVPLVLPPPKSLLTPSSAAARLRSLEHQARGDQRMREQKWSEARLAYADSVSSAPDRAEGHSRLAICYVAISQFESAVKQFKVAALQDPKIAQTGAKLETIFGPSSQIVRNSIISKLGDWAKEDLHSSDRLFLLGAILYYNNDHRARDYLAAALKANLTGNSLHIAIFLNAPIEAANVPPQPIPNAIPQLKDQAAPPVPAPPPVIPLGGDVRFPKGPVPAPESTIPITERPSVKL